jgi:endonuclease YncB( thermonuclease family)
MRSRFARPTGIRQTLVAVLVAISFLAQGTGLQPAAAEVVDNSFIGEQFPFSITWDNSWFIREVMSEAGYEGLILTDGLASCAIQGGTDPSTTNDAALASIVVEIRSDPEVSAFAPRPDTPDVINHGSNQTRAFAVVDYTVATDDGSTVDLTALIDTRLIVPGQSTLFSICFVENVNFDSERPAIEALLANIQIGAAPVLMTAPVFVSGPWRFAVSQAAVGREFPDLGLKLKTDKEWLVVVVDVTNWSDQSQLLSAWDLRIGAGTGGKPIKVSRNKLAQVAEQLGTVAFYSDLTLTLEADQTIRVTLAYLVPAGSQDLGLVHGEQSLQIADLAEPGLDLDGLSVAATAPEVVRGEIVSASDGQTIRVQLEGESSSTRMRLLGVDPPVEGSCFANEAEKVLDDLVGETVLIEEDAAITGGSTPSNYVWLVDRDGTRTLLNQQLIADGAAYAAELPEDARFGAWFEASAEAADLADIGLWAGCPTPTATPKPSRPSPTPNASATPTAKPSATPAQNASPSPTSRPAHPSPTQKPSPTATPVNIFTVRHVSQG